MGFKHFSPSYQLYDESFDAREYIKSKIGEPNIPAFELWAFNSTPHAYDASVRFLWNQTHRTCPLIGSYKSSIMRMVDYWEERFKDAQT